MRDQIAKVWSGYKDLLSLDRLSSQLHHNCQGRIPSHNRRVQFPLHNSLSGWGYAYSLYDTSYTWRTQSAHTQVHTNTHTHIYTDRNTQKDRHTHIQIHTHTHTHKNTHTHILYTTTQCQLCLSYDARVIFPLPLRTLGCNS